MTDVRVNPMGTVVECAECTCHINAMGTVVGCVHNVSS